MTNHIVKSFDSELSKLAQTITEMGEMSAQELHAALQALEHRDAAKAMKVPIADEMIDEHERTVDELGISVIALRQPMAADLRFVIASLKIAKDLERIGDYSKNIAKHAATFLQLKPTGLESEVLKLGYLVHTMLNDVMAAFIAWDMPGARAIRERDIENDRLYSSLFERILNLNCEMSGKAPACTHLIFIARALERIGDHVTAIAEDVVFFVDGKRPSTKRGKADRSASILGRE